MKNEKEATQTTVAKINNTEIVVIENGEKRVAVKPICDALGVSVQGQIEKLKTDPILSSTIKIIFTVGADGKDREMVTIPFKYVFGWLFRIDSRKVNEEARPTVLRYQVECYDALYNHFTRYADFVQQKQDMIEAQLVIVEKAKTDFKSAKTILDDANTQLNAIRKLTIDDYIAANAQLSLFTANEMEG